LRAIEAEVLARAGVPAEDGEVQSSLPSLGTLVRYHARLDRDWRRATEELDALRRDRTVQPSPAQLRIAADLVEQGQAAAAAGGSATQGCADENKAGMSEPDAADRTNENPLGANEPGPPVRARRPAVMAPHSPSLAAGGTDEPATAVQLN
jgi:hypothetical protein